MPVNRVKQIPVSRFPGARKSQYGQLPEFDYAMNALRKGLNGECLEIIIEEEDLTTVSKGIKNPMSAFVHFLEGAIKSEKLNYVVRQRNIDGKDKPSRVYIMSSYVDYLQEKKGRPKKVVAE